MNNTQDNNRLTLRVWGDFACYSRPEMKVERVSYPVITPSAARGILEAIFWEPQMCYLVDTIHIIKRGRWFSVRRNEVTAVISLDSAKTWMKQPEKVSPIQAGGGAEDGTQRNMLALEEVEYLITAEIRLTKLAQPPRDNLRKYIDKIKTRARAGKCFHRPCLGVREFDANFALEETGADAAFARRRQELDRAGAPLLPIPYEPLGLMLYDVFDPRRRESGFRWLHDAAWVADYQKHKIPGDPLEVTDEVSQSEEEFADSIAELKKGEQTKRRKEREAQPRPFKGEKITPHPAFFQAEIRDSVMRCHPDDVKILSQTTEA
ncbi:MAG: type I-C CRISPR-associated protein Cas5c [Puniceicoccales bacterium]|jgi:CRISPR-associated protein Cas5d|nr:type I-C CRISPR-associated protein Cas5c [Puniceicoccales bacterium]